MSFGPKYPYHGAFLEGLKGRLDKIRRGQLLVVVDVSSYRRRVDVPERWTERLQAWERVAREIELTPIELDPDRRIDDDAAAGLGAALWPRPEAAEASA